jgi:hypothetical protein
LTSDKATLSSRINSLTVTGVTAGQIGIAWGWYTLAPGFSSLWPPASQPQPYGSPNLKKIAVLMTDGEFNTPYCNGVIAWVREVFARARGEEAPGVALFMQAQPFAHSFGRSGFIPGFRDFLLVLEEEVRAYGKPVLLVHADSHRYRNEQAVAIESAAERIPNLHRVETFGSRDIHAVEVLVAPKTPEVFFPGPLIVPGNPRPKL